MRRVDAAPGAGPGGGRLDPEVPVKPSLLTAAVAALVAGSAADAFAKTLRVPQQYDSISAAVEAAQDGDRILVAKGTYPGPVTVEGRDGVRLLARGQVTIDGQGAAVPLTIRGCTNLGVVGFRIVNSPGDGLVVEDSSYVWIARCSVSLSGNNGITIGTSHHVRVDRVTVDRATEDGITQEGGTGLVDDSVYSRCRVSDCGEDGIQVVGSRNRVTRNRIAGVASQGVQVEDGSESVVDRNLIDGCGDEGVRVDQEHIQAVVRANRIFDCDEAGILLIGDDARAELNRVVDSDIGVFTQGGDQTVSKNRVDDARSEGIQVNGTNGFFSKNRVESARGDGFDIEGDTNRFEKNVVRRAEDNGFEVNAGGNTFLRNQATRSGNRDLYDDSLSGTNVYDRNRFPDSEIVEGGP